MQTIYTIPTEPPQYESRVFSKSISHGRIYALLDSGFAALGLVLVFWFAGILLLSGFSLSWQSLFWLIIFWVVFSYLALPRMHQLFTDIYLPDYFLSRTKTGDGLLGDPVNLALRGSASDIHAVMRRGGWVKADPITLRTSLGIIKSSLTGASYPAAPVSDLFLFGRRHDFAYQKEVDGSAAQRHHVRFWHTPDEWQLPGGETVDWLAAGTYDKAVGLSSLTFQITHKIDEDIDAERDYIINNARYIDPECDVQVIENFSTAFHDRNGGGDAVYTDGNMPILDVTDADSRAETAGISTAQEDNLTVPKVASLEHRMPPTSLLLVGLFFVIEALLVLIMQIQVWADPAGLLSSSPEEYAKLWGLTILLLLELALYIFTLRHSKWARLALLILISIGAIARMYAVSSFGDVAFVDLMDAGTSLLLVLAMSAPSVRQWVMASTTNVRAT